MDSQHPWSLNKHMQCDNYTGYSSIPIITGWLECYQLIIMPMQKNYSTNVNANCTPCLKKSCADLFCQNLGGKFPPILILFWQADGKISVTWQETYCFCPVRLLENRTAETEFWFLNFEVSSVSRKLIPDIFVGFRTPIHFSSITLRLGYSGLGESSKANLGVVVAELLETGARAPFPLLNQ